MTTYFDLPADVRVLREGDLVDLLHRDQTPANRLHWEHELAEVESVSTHDAPSGGWCDGLLWRDTDQRRPSGVAVIYVTNGAEPAVVLDQPNRKRRAKR